MSVSAFIKNCHLFIKPAKQLRRLLSLLARSDAVYIFVMTDLSHIEFIAFYYC